MTNKIFRYPVVWNGFEFYNLSGFHIFFSDDALDKICHVQLWTLGIGETASIFHPLHRPRSLTLPYLITGSLS